MRKTVKILMEVEIVKFFRAEGVWQTISGYYLFLQDNTPVLWTTKEGEQFSAFNDFLDCPDRGEVEIWINGQVKLFDKKTHKEVV